MKHESIYSIIKWHTETFPEANLNGQIEKFLDEKVEFATASTKELRIEELADCFIVACGISRFNPVYGSRFLGQVFDLFTEDQSFTIASLQDAIDAKMKVNRKRKWSKGKGNYQHVEA